MLLSRDVISMECEQRWMVKKTWRQARIVPTLFIPLFHWMSIMLGTVWFFIYLISTFIPLDVNNFTGAWGMDFVSSSPFFSTTPPFSKFSYKSFLFQNFHNHSFFSSFGNISRRHTSWIIHVFCVHSFSTDTTLVGKPQCFFHWCFVVYSTTRYWHIFLLFLHILYNVILAHISEVSPGPLQLYTGTYFWCVAISSTTTYWRVFLRYRHVLYN
jgi:hypothetical protein